MSVSSAKAAAQDVLSELRISDVPVDVRRIAEQFSVIVAEVPNEDEDLAGLILRSDRGAIIGINKAHSANRKRFTIAHELGHFRLHKGTFVDRWHHFEANFRWNTLRKTKEEAEANAFAAELLMPAGFLHRHFHALCSTVRQKDGTADVELLNDAMAILAKKYEVSVEAIKFRLANLGLLHLDRAGEVTGLRGHRRNS